MIFWGKWYREIQKQPITEILEIWSMSLICYLVKDMKIEDNSQVTDVTQTVSFDDLTQTKPPKPKAIDTVTNFSENPPQNPLPSTRNWQAGHRIKNGKYTIKKELGKGGFGITYLAINHQGKSVVIKMLKDELRDRLDFKQLEEDFINEAVKLSQFKHPNIVPIIEVINDSGWCIVMEYIEGKTLDALVKDRSGYLNEKEALYYIKQIGEALKAVHAKGLLHRDIKPQNILIREDTNKAVLIDFGLALKFNRDPVANSGGLSHGYASLEQYQRNVIWDYYTDVYALAATLYFTLTKTKPISAIQRAGAEKLASAKDINPAVSPHLNATIEKGMNLDPVGRPQTIKQWFDILQTPPKKSKSFNFAWLVLLFVGIGGFVTYFLTKSPVTPVNNGQLVVNKAIERECTPNDLHPLTQKCQKNYFFTGKKGEKIMIEMDSDDIDSLLVLMNAEGIEIAKNDDIEINNFNAKIEMELPENGQYIVSTQSSQKQELGSYTLKLSKN